MALRFAVLFNEVIFVLSGSFVLVEVMTSVFHSVFQETMDIQTIFFYLFIMASATEQTAEPFKPCYCTKITNIFYTVIKSCNGAFHRCQKCMPLA